MLPTREHNLSQTILGNSMNKNEVYSRINLKCRKAYGFCYDVIEKLNFCYPRQLSQMLCTMTWELKNFPCKVSCNLDNTKSTCKVNVSVSSDLMEMRTATITWPNKKRKSTKIYPMKSHTFSHKQHWQFPGILRTSWTKKAKSFTAYTGNTKC